MARAKKEDFRVPITIPDVRRDQLRANEAISAHRKATVYDTTRKNMFGGYVMVSLEYQKLLQEITRECRKNHVRFSLPVACALPSLVDIASKRDLKDDDGLPVTKDGFQHAIMTNSGARVWHTQDEVAELLMTTRASVSATIGVLKKYGIIRDWGEGWFEFDCRLVWRGKIDLRLAYEEVQGQNPALDLTILNNGVPA